MEIMAEGDLRYIAIDGEKDLGFLLINDDLTVHTIYVEPEHRRKGIATALWDAAKLDWPDLMHSGDLTQDGSRWIASLHRRGKSVDGPLFIV